MSESVRSANNAAVAPCDYSQAVQRLMLCVRIDHISRVGWVPVDQVGAKIEAQFVIECSLRDASC